MFDRLFRIGLFLSAGVPLLGFGGLLVSGLIPGCKVGGSGGAASGCYLFGLNLNWFVDSSLVVLFGSMFTVPVGLAIVMLTLFSRAIREHRRRGDPASSSDPYRFLVPPSDQGKKDQ
jgi:hypothetical protein